MEYNAHALGVWKGHTMTNSKEAFLNSYKTGFRFFEVDIHKTIDGQFVARHLWTQQNADNLEIDFDPQNPIPTQADFLKAKMLTQSTQTGAAPLSLEDIFSLMETHPDATVMFDFLAGWENRADAALMKQFADKFTDEKIARRSLIEVYSTHNALALKTAGFKNIQMWIDVPEKQEKGLSSTDEIVAFLKENDIKFISLHPARAINNPQEIGVFHQAGILIFSPGWNTKKSLKQAEKLGIDVVTTDLPMCSAAERLHLLRYRLLSHFAFGKKASKYREKYKRLSECIIRK